MMQYISKTFSRLIWFTFADVCSRNKINGCYKTLFILFLLHKVIFDNTLSMPPLNKCRSGRQPRRPPIITPLLASVFMSCNFTSGLHFHVLRFQRPHRSHNVKVTAWLQGWSKDCESYWHSVAPTRQKSIANCSIRFRRRPRSMFMQKKRPALTSLRCQINPTTLKGQPLRFWHMKRYRQRQRSNLVGAYAVTNLHHHI